MSGDYSFFYAQWFVVSGDCSLCFLCSVICGDWWLFALFCAQWFAVSGDCSFCFLCSVTCGEWWLFVLFLRSVIWGEWWLFVLFFVLSDLRWVVIAPFCFYWWNCNCCINWYFRNKTLFLWLKRPYFHFTDTGVYYPL